MKLNNYKIFIAILFLCLQTQLFSQGWEALADINNPTPFPAMAAAGGKLYLVGGTQGGAASTFEYTPGTNTWDIKSSVPQGTIYQTALTVNGKIYLMGGGQSNVKKDLNYIYDPTLDTWTTGASLLTPRMYHSAAVVNNKIYLIGGQNGDGTTEWYFDEYDPATDTWTRKTQTPHAEAWYCAAVGLDNDFYRIAGGRWNAPTRYFDKYDTETDTWTQLPLFPDSLHAPAAVTIEKKILVMGGICNKEEIDSIYYYTKESDTWTLALNRLPEPMAYHKACVIGNYVYIYKKDDEANIGHLWRYKFGSSPVEDNSQHSNDDISVSPNPSSGKFNIKLNPDVWNNSIIKVYNFLGEEVLSQSNTICENNELNINLENQSSGMYILLLKNGQKTVTRKLIIK